MALMLSLPRCRTLDRIRTMQAMCPWRGTAQARRTPGGSLKVLCPCGDGRAGDEIPAGWAGARDVCAWAGATADRLATVSAALARGIVAARRENFRLGPRGTGRRGGILFSFLGH